uniref:LysR family transcriptional regulator n=1 Tax=Phenylobacterium glaciei TaxID=2803784 RepID=A0A974P2W5_9CAUL|nr:LysR family transcriptional regulator [Phenylobacterium glaciei]
MTAIDLNLLRVFDTLLTERSVTRAGTRLGLSQSAVSHALNRLRYALDDELFVRGPMGMTPTARAQELGPQVHAALSQLQAAFAPRDFDPATTERRFTVVAGAYACAVLIPPLVSRLAEEAPNVELVVADAAVDVLEQLDARRADFVVGAVVAGPARLSVSPLLTDSLVWTVRAQSPLSGAPSAWTNCCPCNTW